MLFVLHLLLFAVLAFYFGKKVWTSWKDIADTDSYIRIDWLALSAIFAPIVLVAFTRFFNATLQIPVEYDNLAYHLPFMAEWFQTGSLWHIYYSAYAGPLGYYPSNFGLIDLFAVLPFGNDLLVNLTNLPVFLVFPFAFYGLLRNFLVTHKPAIVMTALFFVMPVTLRQLGTPLVDLFFCLTFILSGYFLLEYRKTKNIEDIILMGLSLGLFMGTKYLGIVYGMPLIGIVLLYIMVRSLAFKKQKVQEIVISFFSQIWSNIKKYSLHFLVFLLAIAMTGSFWYIRNFVNSGNPIFPTEVKAFGMTILPGYTGITDNLVATSLAQNIPSERSFQYFYEGLFQMVGSPLFLMIIGLIGLVFTVVILLGIALSTHKKEERTDTLTQVYLYIILLVCIAIYAIGYWISPYSFKDLIPNVRYAFMAILLGLLALGITVTRFKLLQPLFYVSSFIGIAYNFVYLVLFPSQSILTNEKVVLDFPQMNEYLHFAFLFAIIIYGILLLFYLIRYIHESKWMPVIAGTLVVSISFLGYFYFNETRAYRELLREDLYTTWYSKNAEWIAVLKAAEWLNNNDHAANVAYTGFNMHYPLYGRNLERHVTYVNINACLPCRYIDYRNEKDSIRANPDYNAWRKNLKLLQMKYILVEAILDPAKKNYEYDWIKKNVKSFQKVTGDTFKFNNGVNVEITLYKILD